MKDEEDWLPRCLSSVKDLVDEIIIVDTGSKDRSVDIAKSFGAKVLFHPWVDDFAKVRNFSLQNATGDWILVLDADEILLPQDHLKIRKLMEREDYCYLLTQRHYTNDVRLSGFEPSHGEFPELEKGSAGYFESALGRLFPNYKGIHYRGAVHELVEFCIDEMPDIKLADPKIRLHHYGHTEWVRAKKDKSKLYTPLGEKKVTEDAKGWKEWFELAVEHNNNRRIKESIVAFEESLKLNDTYVSSWINYGYVLCEDGRYQESIKALLKALELEPNSEEAFCNLGVAELRLNNLSQAEKYFRICIKLKPNYVNALRNLAITLTSQGRFSEAVLVLNKILQFLPNDYQTLMSLGSLYLNVGNGGEALKYFSYVYQVNPDSSDLVLMIAHSLKLSGEAAQSLRFLSTHIKERASFTSESNAKMLKKALDQESISFFLS